MPLRLTVWQTRSEATRAFLRSADPDLAAWLERCPHGRRVRVPGAGLDVVTRDAAIRAEVHRLVAEGRSRSWAIEAMAEAHRLTYRHVQRIVAGGGDISGTGMS